MTLQTNIVAGAATLVEVLRRRAVAHPDRLAVIFLSDGENELARLTYGQLDQQARSIATALREQVGPGERALLLYPPGLDFIAGFFGCLYAGIVAVPLYMPRPRRPDERVASIAKNSEATVALGLPVVYPAVPKDAPRLRTTVTAGHNDQDIDLAVKVIGQSARTVGLIR